MYDHKEILHIYELYYIVTHSCSVCFCCNMTFFLFLRPCCIGKRSQVESSIHRFLR
eukprot:UN13340